MKAVALFRCPVAAFFLASNSLLGFLFGQTAPIPAAANPPAATNLPATVNRPPAVASTKPPPAAAELQRAALAQQRAAIRVQAESLGLWLMPLDGDPSPAGAETAAPPACEPLDDRVSNTLIEDAAKAQSLDAKLLRAVISQESAFRPCAVSNKGAQGLMQLMPETAAELGVADPFDPKQNIEGGARYLKQLIEKYKGDLPRALSAYNAGPKTVDDSGGLPDVQETRQYTDAILAQAGLKPDPPAKPAEPGAAGAEPAAAPPQPVQEPSRPAGTPAKPQSKPGGQL